MATRSCLALVVWGATLAPALPAMGQVLTPRADTGLSLVVPKEAKGRAYHVVPGPEVQVTLRSAGGGDEVAGHAGGLVGFLVVPDDGRPLAEVALGELQLAPDALRTGVSARDAAARRALDAPTPTIALRIKRTENVAVVEQHASYTTWTCRLLGDLLVHGVRRPVSIDATLSALPESDATQALASGDLLRLRASFLVDLSDYRVDHRSIARNMGELVKVELALHLSSVPPEEQPGATDVNASSGASADASGAGPDAGAGE